MSDFRLVRDELGFFSQVPIEDEPPPEEIVPLHPEASEVLAADWFDVPKKRGRPRREP